MTFKTVITLLAVFALLAPCSAMDRLSALSMLESGDNDQAIGKSGEVSRWQILPSVWHQYSSSTNYADSFRAQMVEVAIMEPRESAFLKSKGHWPTDFEFYVLWNAPAQAMSGKISNKVRERAQRFENLCKRKN